MSSVVQHVLLGTADVQVGLRVIEEHRRMITRAEVRRKSGLRQCVGRLSGQHMQTRSGCLLERNQLHGYNHTLAATYE